MSKPYVSIDGVIDYIIYQSSDSGYAVCALDSDGGPVVIVGSMPYIEENERVTVRGYYETHPEYGEQLKVHEYEKRLYTTQDELFGYLSSGCIKGLGKALARRIIDEFGDDTLYVLGNEPQRLAAVQGISESKAQKLHEAYAAQFGMQDLCLYLARFGLSVNCAARIYDRYSTGSLGLIRNDPYRFAEGGYGISFEKADQIARTLGFADGDERRIAAGVFFTLRRITSRGHTCYPRHRAAQQAAELLGLPMSIVDAEITQIAEGGRIALTDVELEPYVALTHIYDCEAYCADKLLRYAYDEPYTHCADVDERIGIIEGMASITLAAKQRQALALSLQRNVLVITGGPGTGKTTVIRSIARLADMYGKSVILCAPTGRAAKRMSELCDVEAKTIHRLLEAYYDEDAAQMSFGRGSHQRIDCDVIIIDECSMLDTTLLYSVLTALPRRCHIIMVGDCDQLPSIGHGNVLRDIIQSKCVPCVGLDEIFRQDEHSHITLNAHRINKGEMPVTSGASDFFFMRRDNLSVLLDDIRQLITKRLPDAYAINPMTDIEVLTPTRIGDTGSRALNAQLQQWLNPAEADKPELKSEGLTLRLGDKVMHIKNNYRLDWVRSNGDTGSGVYNGDVGFIVDVDVEAETLTVRYDDDRHVVYNKNTLNELEHAYALTIHKSQGSEFDTCIIPLFVNTYMQLSRNLLYTAVTRAKKRVILIGRAEVLRQMVQHTGKDKRYTLLGCMLRNGRDQYKT